LQQEIQALERKVMQKADSWEISTIKDNVRTLSTAIDSACTIISGLESRVETLESRINTMENDLIAKDVL
jgi:predicted  nucleic acid-binding Zn-ribbon protein